MFVVLLALPAFARIASSSPPTGQQLGARQCPLALRGDAKAQNNPGEAYRDGDGIGQGDESAVLSFRKAAEQADADAPFNLIAMYDEGRGAANDVARTARWNRKAADQGDADA